MNKRIVSVGAAVLSLAVLATAGFLAARLALAPLPGEWSVPLRMGPVEIDAGVPSLIRLATSAWGGPLLDGREFETRHGRLRLSWQSTRTLLLRCAPCTLQPPGLGEPSLQLAAVQLTVRRQGERLAGEVSAGRVRGSWRGELAQGQLRLRLDIPATLLVDGFALFAAEIPELASARIQGQFSLQAQLSLPAGSLSVTPRLEGFEVAGLGSEALANARSSCGRGQRASRLTPDSWLARAAVAAEDQRFFEHRGYDLAELGSALARNHEAQQIERGASTLSQQLAKMLITGADRSPARKLRELLWAAEMERTLGKARILRLYLDNAPWGPQLCGAEAAAMHYFGLRAHQLAPAQAAWLAAMLHNPAAHARRWEQSGQIDLARTRWVVMGMRGLSRQQKLALAAELPALDWRPYWAEPERDGYFSIKAPAPRV